MLKISKVLAVAGAMISGSAYAAVVDMSVIAKPQWTMQAISGLGEFYTNSYYADDNYNFYFTDAYVNGDSYEIFVNDILHSSYHGEEHEMVYLPGGPNDSYGRNDFAHGKVAVSLGDILSIRHTYFPYGAKNGTVHVRAEWRAADPIASAVPEAATWAMMISGFGLVGVALRRRRATLA